ncbi:MAG: site-specific integrase [Paraglaciecola sp.]|uniref:site-specific integrase n=1 Tax=Paraglaciecola sp. TaxID=1920173 RepID=UPI003296DBE0
MNTKIFEFATGEQYCSLIGDDGLPMAYPSLFVTVNHRNSTDAFTTIDKEVRHIRYLYEICQYLCIDLEQKCLKGEFLKKAEMNWLVKWAGRTVKSFRNHVAKNKKFMAGNVIPKITKLESARANIVIEGSGHISPHTHFNRITTFARYIGWLELYCFSSKQGNAEETLKTLRPKKFSNVDDIDEHAMLVIDCLDEPSRGDNIKQMGETLELNAYHSLTKSQRIRVMDVLRPDSSDNPWGESVRVRNQLTFHLLDATGVRRGELARIRINDIIRSKKNGRKYLRIRKREDKKDKRLDRPKAKTLGRIIPITSELALLLEDCIVKYRSKISGVERIDYLLVPHRASKSKGIALSLSSINKICSQLTKVVGFKVNPHSFRHSWNDDFSEIADDIIRRGESTEAKTESDRRKLMGWTEESKMAMKYGKRHADRRAFQTGLPQNTA